VQVLGCRKGGSVEEAETRGRRILQKEKMIGQKRRERVPRVGGKGKKVVIRDLGSHL
jgi:hypothetical protein